MKKCVKFVFVPLGFLIFVGALALLHNQLKNFNYVDIANALKAIPLFKIVIALFLALSYYVVLSGYDMIAFKYIDAKTPLKLRDILFTCFISNALGNNMGYSMLFGGSIRYRFYSIYNISIANVTKVLLFSSATVWLGLFTLGGLLFTVVPFSLEDVIGFDFSSVTIGLFLIGVVVLYVLLSALRTKPIKIFKWTLTFPNIKIVSSQIVIAACDWVVASLTLYVLLPVSEIPYFVFLKVFLVAQLLGVLSQVPGGMGVFEASFALLLPTSANNPEVIGGLLAYRAVFYFFPLLIALMLLGSFELMLLTKKFNETAKIFGKTVSSIMVQVLAVSSFFAGMVVMFTTSMPFNDVQLELVKNLLPAWVADLSYFLLSAMAVGLLFIARGLQLRIKNAWNIACVLVGLAVVLILIVGTSPVVIFGFTALIIALLTSKKYFYRSIPILNTAFSIWWFGAVVGVFVLSIWIGFFVNRQNIFFWIHPAAFFENILSASDTARFLRASLGIGLIIFVVILEQISKSFFRKTSLFTKHDIKNIVNSSDYAYSFNALTLDKSYIVNDEKDAFIMYASSRNNMIAFGDPVGTHGRKNEFLWKFKEIADETYAKPIFVCIDYKYVRIYEDIGLDIFKIGQEAKIVLKYFSKEKERLKYFYSIEKEMEEAGFEFRIIEAGKFEQYRGIFVQIDKEWKTAANYVEVNFIPGKYDESYMKDMDFSVVEKDGVIYAFSVIAKTASKYEASCRIVRYRKCRNEIFPYIVFKNVLWAEENKYKFFNLGITYFPLKDNENEAMKYFARTFMFAEHFNYNLASLRKFKNKFLPVWHEYVAMPHDNCIISFIENFTVLIFPVSAARKRRFFRK